MVSRNLLSPSVAPASVDRWVTEERHAVGISKDNLGRYVRAAIVSGLLGAAGFGLVTAGPVYAQSDPSDPAEPSDPAGPSDPSDPGTDGGTDSSVDGGIGGTDLGVGGSDSGILPNTGGDSSLVLLAGAGAAAGAAALRVARRT